MNYTRLTLLQLRYVNKAFWRNPAAAFFTFAFPLMFLVIFTALLGHGEVRLGGRSIHQSTYYVAAMGSFAVITSTYTYIAMSLAFQRDTGVLKRTNGTPLPAAVYFAARVLHALLVSILLVVITVTFGKLVYQAEIPSGAALGRFVAMLAVGAAAFSALG
ncbi:MAG TPA: ABC transporter permease, partial [Actinocrinis sp.]|uniref:ABC transporter permease n=1 Tax=Actinocrinis sp. TaxID=1920516 RepID=UPI002DDCBEA2